jgi:protein-tyrosine phosphatase
MKKEPFKVMFVCAGNICRSPLAHAMFDKVIQKEGVSHLFQTESSGTNGYHVGELPDPRTRENASGHSLAVDHISRKFEGDDLKDWDLLLVMDKSNYRNVMAKTTSQEEKNKVHLFREWDPQDAGAEVPDPYMGGTEGFEHVYQIVQRTTEHLVKDLVQKISE